MKLFSGTRNVGNSKQATQRNTRLVKFRKFVKLRLNLATLALVCIATATLGFASPALAVIRLGSPNTVSLSQGLVSYWPLDGAVTHWNTNTTADLSGQGNTGQLIGMSTTSSPTPGKIGQALKFDGSTNYVNMGNVLHPTGAFTYSAWIYRTKPPVDSYPTIMGRYAEAGVSETWFGINGINGTPLGMWVYTDNNNYIGRKYSGTLSPDTWYHVAGVYDGGTMGGSIKLYLNGVQVDNASENSGTFTSIANTATPFTIGAISGANYYFAGKMDDVRIYNRALSAQEVKQLYNMGR